MKLTSRGLPAVLLASALLCAPASADAVTVNLRVEGAAKTYFEGPVTTDARNLPDASDGSQNPCNYRDNGSSHGDPSRAVAGTPTTALADWAAASGTPLALEWTGGSSFGDVYDFFVDRVADETTSTEGAAPYWRLYVNGKFAESGGCQYIAEPGADVVWSYGAYGEGALRLTAPTGAKPGQTFTAKVTDSSDGSAVEGASVGGKATNAAGEASVVLDRRGPNALKAEKQGFVRSNVAPVCVSDGQDGHCGSRTPQGTTVTPAPAGPAAKDVVAPKALVSGIVDGRRFRGRGPRQLRGRAGEPVAGGAVQPDGSGLLMVKLRLTRDDNGRCSTYSVKRERFVPVRCGASHGWWFRIGDRSDWEYLLPSALPRGRYVLDVNVIDKAYNRDDRRRRGENRVVFTVA